MLRDDDHWLAVTDAFYSAALSQQGWYQALEGLAHATGSANGELIGLGANAAVPFNIFTNIDPAFVTDFVAAGGGDPALNPRVGAALYNTFHHKGVAVAMFVAGVYFSNSALQFSGLLFFGHSSFDRLLGYGLKYPDSFHNTHLGPIGKSDKQNHI